MKCKKCNKVNPKGSKFCSSCGGDLEKEMVYKHSKSSTKTVNPIDNLFKISLIIGVSIAALSIAYYYVIFIPQRENRLIELQQTEANLKQKQEEEKEDKLQNCLSKASADYDFNWNNYCKDFGIDASGNINRKDNCLLPKAKAEQVEEFRKNDEDKCFKLYK